MGAGVSVPEPLPKNEAAAIAAGFTQDEIRAYKASSRTPSTPQTADATTTVHFSTPNRSFQRQTTEIDSPADIQARFEEELARLQADNEEEVAHVAELRAMENDVTKILEIALSDGQDAPVVLPRKKHDVGGKAPLVADLGGMYFDERERAAMLHDAREALRLNRALAASLNVEIERIQGQLDKTAALSGPTIVGAEAQAVDEAPGPKTKKTVHFAPTQPPAAAEATAAGAAPTVDAAAAPSSEASAAAAEAVPETPVVIAPLETLLDEDELEDMHERVARAAAAIKEERFTDFKVSLPSMVCGL